MLQQSKPLFVGFCRSHKRDVHSVDFVYLVENDFGKDYLLGNTKRIISLSVHFTLNTAKIADTRQCCRNKPFEKLIHAVAAQCYAHSDWHFLSQLKIGNVSSG